MAEARVARRTGWLVAIGGGDARGAAAAAQQLVDDGAQALVSLGLAGGLDPTLRAGAIVVPSSVLIEGRRLHADPAFSRRLGGITHEMVVDSDHVVVSVEEKRLLYDRTHAAAVDMESGAVARIATSRDVPFAVLRAICDPADRALPPAAVAAVNSRGAIVALRLLASLVAHPLQLAALWTLAADAAAARRALLTRVRQFPQFPE